MPNIIDIGFDWKKAEADKDRVVAAMEQILEVGQRMGKVKFSFGPGIQEFKRLNEEVRKLSNDLTAAVDRMSKALKANTDERKKSAQTATQQIKEEKELVRLMQEEEKLEQQSIKTKKLRSQESANAAKAAANEKKMADELADEYAQLSKAYNETARKAKNYALILGENHPVTQGYIKDAKGMYDILLRVDQAVGQNQRNVGNYKSAFDGLTMSVAQISRELPSLTISVQQFALAISNNLPMLADEIAKAKVEIAALKAEGKDTPSLFARIAQSTLSWQVGLSVVIALVTALSGRISEWISGIFDTEAALKKQQQQQQLLNDSLREQLELEKKVNEARTNTDLGNVQALKNQLDDTRALNKEKGVQLNIEKQLTFEEFRKADALFQTAGGYDKLEEKSKALLSAQIQYDEKVKEFQFSIQNPDLSSKSTDNLKEELDMLRTVLNQRIDDYNEVKKINEGYATSKEAWRSKELEVEEFYASESRKLTLETIRIEKGDTIDKNDKILASDKSTLLQRLEALRSNLAARKAIIEAEKKNTLNDPSSTSVDKAIAIKTAAAANAKAEREADKQIFDVKQEFYNRILQAKYETDKILIESDQSAQERIYNNEVEGLQNRLDALNHHSENQRSLIEKEYGYQKELLSQKATTDEEYKRLEADKDAKLVELTATTQKQIVDIIKQTNERLQNEQNAVNNAFYKFITQTNIADVERAQSYAKDVIALNKALQDKKISVEQYEKQRKEIEEKYGKESLESAIEKQKNLIEAKKASGESILEDEKRLAEMQMELDDKTTSRKLENQRKIKDATRQLYEETLTFIQTLIDAGYQEELNALHEKADQSDKNYEQEIENIQNSTLSEQDKADKIKILEAQQRADKAKFDREQRAVQERQARFDRAIQIAKIIGNTASAVTAALPNIPLSILMGALGAVQLATILARPIPKYAKGTKDHPGGLAYLGDGGRHELVETPGGSSFLSSNTTTLYDLPKGSRVTPIKDDVLNEILNKQLIIQTAGMLRAGQLLQKKRDELSTNSLADKIVRAIEKNKTVVKPAKGVSDKAIQLQIEKNKWRFG